jgi:hypothetical protein
VFGGFSRRIFKLSTDLIKFPMATHLLSKSIKIKLYKTIILPVVLEECVASIFRVEVCKLGNWFRYARRYEGRWSLRPAVHSSISLP